MAGGSPRGAAMRAAIAVTVALLLCASLVTAGSAQAKPSSYCEPADEGTGAHCHVQLWEGCAQDLTVTVEDGYQDDSYCYP